MNELGAYKISWSELHFSRDDEIGLGSFCRVYKGRCRGMDVAIRLLLKPLLQQSDVEAFHREVKLMRYVLPVPCPNTQALSHTQTFVCFWVPASNLNTPCILWCKNSWPMEMCNRFCTLP